MEFPLRVIFDTTVLVAAARSRMGASFALVNAIPSEQFEICLFDCISSGRMC
jgi:predicted nucleic acid-binding protein